MSIKDRKHAFSHKKNCIVPDIPITDEEKMNTYIELAKIEKYELLCKAGKRDEYFRNYLDSITDNYVKMEMLEFIQKSFKALIN
jgi:hypothetical protein